MEESIGTCLTGDPEEEIPEDWKSNQRGGERADKWKMRYRKTN